MKRKALAIVCTAALAVGGTFLLNAANSPSKAAAPAPFTAAQHFAGYATGTDVFADALKNLQAGMELANVNIGYSASAANSDGLLTQYVPAGVAPNSKALTGPFSNEMDHAVVPPTEASFGNTPTGPFQSYGRGSGLEVGLGTSLPNNPDLNQIILTGMAEQMATPKTPGGNTFPDESLTKEIAVPADPLIFASLLKGQAAANWDADNCPGDPAGTFPVNPTGFSSTGGAANTDNTKALGWGLGQAAQVELLNTAMGPLAKPLGDPNSEPLIATTGGSPTNRAVSSAKSFSHLVPNGDGTFALVSEIHETIAPVTLFKGTTNQVTIEVIGEAILRAISTGTLGTTKVAYSPPGLVRVTQGNMPPQEFPFPAPGGQIPPIQVVIPGMLPNLLELELGEGPRAPDQAIPGNSDQMTPKGPIVTTAAGQTVAWGATDLVRARLIVPALNQHVAEVRIGHMEVQSAVPTGGVTCNIPNPGTTAAPGSSSTTAATTPGGATTTTAGPGATTSTTATPGGGTTPSNNTTTTAKPNNIAATTTTAPAQVQAVTFSQTPAATPQNQTPKFTG